MTEKIIALQHEGAWFYWLPEIRSWPGTTTRWVATNGPVQEDLLVHGRRNWWTGTIEAETLASITAQRAQVVGYRLRDPAAVSELFPLEMTPERWAEVGDREIFYSLYEAITEPVEDVATVYEGPWLRADGDPPPNDGRAWSAKLPYQLSQHPELLHLFPGQLGGGFREALAVRLREIPGVRNVYTNNSVSVYVEVPYTPDRTRWQGAILRNGNRSKTRGADVRELKTRHIEWHLADSIAGDDRADAVQRWDAAIEKYVALVVEMATARPCGACGGEGLAPWGNGR